MFSTCYGTVFKPSFVGFSQFQQREMQVLIMYYSMVFIDLSLCFGQHEHENHVPRVYYGILWIFFAYGLTEHKCMCF